MGDKQAMRCDAMRYDTEYMDYQCEHPMWGQSCTLPIMSRRLDSTEHQILEIRLYFTEHQYFEIQIYFTSKILQR